MKLWKTIAAAAVLLSVNGTVANAYDVCGELWVERNQIYKNNGYCFKTRDAIRYFGNAGCSYDYVEDVPLSRAERRRVQNIVAAERRNRCNR
jgi:YARHG domain